MALMRLSDFNEILRWSVDITALMEISKFVIYLILFTRSFMCRSTSVIRVELTDPCVLFWFCESHCRFCFLIDFLFGNVDLLWYWNHFSLQRFLFEMIFVVQLWTIDYMISFQFYDVASESLARVYDFLFTFVCFARHWIAIIFVIHIFGWIDRSICIGSLNHEIFHLRRLSMMNMVRNCCLRVYYDVVQNDPVFVSMHVFPEVLISIENDD